MLACSLRARARAHTHTHVYHVCFALFCNIICHPFLLCVSIFFPNSGVSSSPALSPWWPALNKLLLAKWHDDSLWVGRENERGTCSQSIHLWLVPSYAKFEVVSMVENMPWARTSELALSNPLFFVNWIETMQTMESLWFMIINDY